ncbi:mismatch-specific DNA-glycosylase [Bosea sp. BK604]|uniref:mismatch-specific DNA-glycosylase n=1 Tax=Bosea sp. BK604 TaxID=2512180 RepID=UPI0010DBC64E|nr:mismatch-specific DNA-glycosylase [Bosea sp. BK604]TCR61366.1 G/U mismatch-specific uracil-DNA glycosylase [Bosea sp. BK604]
MTILPDVVGPGLGIVFCGTQAGRVSALRRAYYAGPGNKFWGVLHAVGLVPRQLRPEDYPELLEHGFGLTDVAKATSGPDAALVRAHFDVEGFLMKMRAAAPAFIAFNGKRAAQAALGLPAPMLSYGRQAIDVAGCTAFVLPSTSGAASGFWSIEPWHELAAAWRAERGQQ